MAILMDSVDSLMVKLEQIIRGKRIDEMTFLHQAQELFETSLDTFKRKGKVVTTYANLRY